MRYFLVIIYLVCLMHICNAQDTTRYGASVRYSSAIDTFRGMQFASRAKYAKEEIVFSPTHKKIEYCYYYDSERVCFGDEYYIIADSILKINNEEWIFEKQKDLFYLRREFKGFLESGYAKNLIPLVTTGLFTTTTKDTKDTLWQTDYAAQHPGSPYDLPDYLFYKTTLTGKRYTVKDVDFIPAWLKSDSMMKINLLPDGYCINESYRNWWILSFTLTDKGRIVNIEEKPGENKIAFCPYYVMDIVRHLYQLPPIDPVLKNGKPVNVKCTIKVRLGE